MISPLGRQTTRRTLNVAEPAITPVTGGVLQRACACGKHTSAGGECEECNKKREGTLQRATVNTNPVHQIPPIVHEVLRSPGQLLDPTTRAFMEPRFGHDFSSVRVHTDAKAAESGQAVNAPAYTVGRDIVFGAGQHTPQTAASQKLMAHELTHVVQQARAVSARESVRPFAVPAQQAHSFSSIAIEAPARRVEWKYGVVHGPAGAANRFDDCPAQWKTSANAAQKLGSSWLANVVVGLASLPKPIPAPVANLLTKHFHTTFDKDIAKILGRFAQLNTAINQSIDFECETSCDPNVLGYVYSIWSDLHLCPYWFNSVAELQASTVIHELAHDVVGCDDNAYEWQTAKYSGMSVDDAINNADSYAHFAWEAYY